MNNKFNKILAVCLIAITAHYFGSLSTQAVEVDNPTIIKDINPGSTGSGINSALNLTKCDNQLFFNANNGVNGGELWKSDGTEEGTMMVKDIHLGNESSDPANIATFNNSLFFRADNGTNGAELWKSDGTEGGTMMVADINPGAAGSLPYQLMALNEELVFTAINNSSGRELWKTNGTESGTIMTKDINSDISDSQIYSLTELNNKLFFSANDGIHGVELWSYESSSTTSDLVPPVFMPLSEIDDRTINIDEDQNITTTPFIIKVKPIDDEGIDKVEFYIDDSLICTETASDKDGIYSCAWNTSEHHSTVKTIAYDTSSNTSTLIRGISVTSTTYTETAIPAMTELPKTGR